MSYSKTNWADYAQPALSAANLNKIETGVADAHTLYPISTISDLKSLTGISNGEWRWVAGNYAAGDGGEGWVKRNTSLTSFNEGTAYDHLTEAGGWERSVSREINIKWFAANASNIAPSRNYALYSEQLENSAWAKSNVTVTANNATDPNSGTTADTVNVTSAFGFLSQAVSGPPWRLVSGETYTFSAWVRRGTGTGNPSIVLGGGTAVDIPVSSTLTRVSGQVVAGSGTTVDIYFANTGTYILWGIQLDLGTTVVPYVSTTANQDTNENYSPSAQSASNLAASMGGKEVLWPAGDYLIGGDVDVPAGVTWRGLGWTPNRFSGSGYANPRGATLLNRGAQFRLARGATVDGFTIFYDRQKTTLGTDGVQPDGIEDWTTYPFTFRLDGQLVTLKRITYIGGTHFATQKADNTVYADTLRLDEILGCPLKVGLQLDFVTDIPRVTNVHWNLNSYYDFIPSGTKTNMHTKLAKNATAFLAGRVDEWYMQNVFVYGFREFVWFKNQSASNSNDTGLGFGGAFSNCGGDIVHTAFRISRSESKWFGLKLSNCWFTPMAKSPIISGAVSSESPSFIRFDSAVTLNNIQASDCHIYSDAGGVTQVSDSGAMTNAFIFHASVGTNNRVLFANSVVTGHTGTLTTGATANSLVNTSNVLSNGTVV